MASVKEMRNRIGSVKATQKITKAMQMVAAAKLRRAQDAAQNARPYAERMAAVIANLASGVSGDGAPKLLVGTGSDRRHFTDSIASENVWKAWLGWIHPRSEKGIRWVQSCESHVQEHVVRARLRIRHFPELKLLNSFIGVHQPCAHL